MDELTVRQNSRDSATVTDRVLRETLTTRLVFRPMLVNNKELPAAAVKGTLVYQRKSPKKSWDDIEIIKLTSLNADEGYRLTLDSAETLKLFDQLRALYRIYEEEGGIPVAETKYVRKSNALSSLVDLSEEQFHQLLELEANAPIRSALIARLLAWAADNARDLPKLLGILEKLGPEALANLNTAVSLRALEEGLELWRTHQDESKEKYWQELLATRPFLLEQIFPWPCKIIAGKAYVGGKNVHNTGGKMVDFLVENKLTTSVALVEIKTPKTKITGRDYRDGIPSVSWDLAGSVLQVLTYKDSLKEEYATRRGSRGGYGVFDPPCVVIIGNTQELNTDEKILTLELFRRQLKDVQVITFDELFGRVEKLIQLLKVSTVAPVSEEPEFEKLPF